MTLSDEQRKQIEREAEKEYPYMGGLTGAAMNESCRTARIGYKKAAEKYTLLCQQKDEEIARLRSALGRIEQYSDPGSYATAIVEMKAIATEALKPIMP